MGKVSWLSAFSGVVLGAVIVGAAWEVTLHLTKDGPVVASVGSTAIRQKALDKQVEQTAGSAALTSMIEQQLIQDAAKKYGVTATSAEIKNAKSMVELQEGITSDADLQQALNASKMTMDQFNSMLKTQVLAEHIAEKKVNVTDKQIQSYYLAHKSSFTTKGKTQPLSAVKSKIVTLLKQQNAEAPLQLLADLAKTDKIQINDPSYSGVKTQIENPTTSSTGG